MTRSLSVFLLALVAACGGSTERASTNTGGTAGQGGSSGTVGASGNAGRGGVSGVGAEGGVAGVGAFGGVSGAGAEGGVGAFGGVGGTGGLSCVRTQDRAQIAVERVGYGREDCSTASATAPTKPYVLEGRITRSLADSFELDTCAPNADCAVTLVRIEVRVPGLNAYLPLGAFVRVTYQITGGYGCGQALEVSAMPTWGGVANPYPHNSALMLAISDGGGTFTSSPYEIDRVALGCRPITPSCSSEKPDEYALVFLPGAGSGGSVQVGMGESKVLDLGQPLLSYMARNLRSFQTEHCDDYGNFAWVITTWGPLAER
jgi:hypothetical protein